MSVREFVAGANIKRGDVVWWDGLNRVYNAQSMTVIGVATRDIIAGEMCVYGSVEKPDIVSQEDFNARPAR